MTDGEQARATAERDAPRPKGSALTYGLIGAVLAMLVLLAFTQFYALDLGALPIGVAAAFGLTAGIVVRVVRKARHRVAMAREIEGQTAFVPATARD